MGYSKVGRAIAALDECADALDALPDGLRRKAPFFGTAMVNTQTLREESEWIEAMAVSVGAATKPEPADADGEG